jgi:hypothetical protein
LANVTPPITPILICACKDAVAKAIKIKKNNFFMPEN